MPKLCVLIPAYNCQDDLNRTLRSLMAEAKELDFTVIIVDDGSKVPIVVENEKLKAVVIRLEKNQGLVGALNAGLNYAQAENYELVARLDAGDENIEGRFRKQMAELKINPSLVLVGANALFVNPKGEVVGQSDVPITYEQILKKLPLNTPFIHPSTMMRMSVLNKTGYYNPAFKYAEDYELFFRISREHPVGNLAETLIKYEVSDKQQSHQKWKNQVLYRFFVQKTHFNWKSFGSWQGIIRTMFLLMIPQFIFVARRKRKLNYE